MDSQIRNMTEAEVHLLVKWAEAEGWNPGLNDASVFWDLDPNGYLGLEVNGELIGGGAIIRHNATFGFMGLFIIHPTFRGQQLGTQLWYARRDKLLNRLDTGGTIGLDAVDAMIPFYERGGFREYTRHRRFELSISKATTSVDSAIVNISSVGFDQVEQLDRQCFPGKRSDFLKSWIQQPGHISLAVVHESQVRGFGVMRPCQTGWKIGPLFANDLSIADRLFHAFQNHAQGAVIYLDIPDNNPSAIKLCQKHGMSEVFGCLRMYLGSVPELANEKIFGITTLEVG